MKKAFVARKVEKSGKGAESDWEQAVRMRVRGVGAE